MTASTETTTTTCCGRARRWRAWLVGVAAAAAVVVGLWFAGLLPGRGGLDALAGRPQDALLGIVDVFKCCLLTWKAFTVMLPAFLLAGAIATFVPTAVVLKYLGARAHKGRAYAVAAVSGIILALCSCNIVPLFVSIYRRGAGLGPAFTFLYAGPAINVVAILFTVQVIGWQLGVWRAVGVPLIALAAGLTMAALFRRERRDEPATQVVGDGEEAVPMGRVWALFALLLLLVAYGAWEMGLAAKVGGMAGLAAATLGLLAVRFQRAELAQWLSETWGLLKLVIPVMLPAVIIIGIFAAYIDVKLVYRLVGPAPAGSGLWAWLQPIVFADLFGALMYFPILSEVAFTKAFLKLGMDIGPALAVLLTGAGLSLPGLVIVGRAIGWRKTLAYQAVVVVLTTAFAAFFASEAGRYICACMMMD